MQDDDLLIMTAVTGTIQPKEGSDHNARIRSALVYGKTARRPWTWERAKVSPISGRRSRKTFELKLNAGESFLAEILKTPNFKFTIQIEVHA